MTTAAHWIEDYHRIEQALSFLVENYQRQPELDEVARLVGLSEYHFQRLFTRWAGISPKRFVQFLTKEHAKDLLSQSADLLSAAHASGLSGPGRLHDLFVACEAVTPGEYKRQGAGMLIAYGFHPSPFGECFLASTDRGVCALTFTQPGGRSQPLAALHQRWQLAEIYEDSNSTGRLASQIFSHNPLAGQEAPPVPLQVYLKGTNFQIKVWEALLRIPMGWVASYEDVAAWVGAPHSARAVGHALATNPVAYLIPCHRVIRKAGDFGQYQWGRKRKLALLGWEISQADRLAVGVSAQ